MPDLVAVEERELQEYLERRLSARTLKVPNHPKVPEIEHGIPMPPQRGGVAKFDHFYPFELMKPGDSFWVPSNTFCTAGAIHKFAKRTGWKFVSRGQHQDGKPNNGSSKKNGTRVWRTA